MKNLLLVITFLISTITFAQGEAANWYFGNAAGLRFNQGNGTVTSLNDGQLSTTEGCATISDSNGNLLLYTDGSIVWNRNHTIMANGTGLLGDFSSTQSGIIVPKPDDPNIYYVFTVDDIESQNDPNVGLHYSEVDISLEGGLGRVTQKNINLLEKSTEKISAVLRDCIDKSIWVITLASEDGTRTDNYNTFHAFEINSNGVNMNSITSTFTFNSPITDARGYLKFSPNGTRMASASIGNGLFLYDFDASTGVVSNQQELTISPENGNVMLPYGLEFSQSNQFLYVHSFIATSQEDFSNPNAQFSTLTQFDVTVNDIENSEFLLDSRQLYRGGLQLGPDGKIYRALSATFFDGLPFLGVIDSPNNPGIAANYRHNAINLSPNLSTQGLPPFIQSIFNTQIDIIRNGESTTNLNLCDGDTFTLTADDILGATYTWTLDGNLLPETDFDLIINQGGRYDVFIDPNNGDCPIEGQAFVTFNPNPEAFTANLVQCDDDGLIGGLTVFNLDEANDVLTGGFPDRSTQFYLSQANAENDIEEISNIFETDNLQTIIYVRVTNNITGCFSISELTLEVSLTNATDAILSNCDDDGIEDGLYTFTLSDANNDVTSGLPNGLTVTYYETSEDAFLELNPLSDNYTNTIPFNQTIFVRVENDNACFGINQLELIVNELPNIEIESEAIYCINFFPETITLSNGILEGNPEDFTYLWSTGETTPEIQVNEIGIFTVTITNENMCSKLRTINVVPSNIATFENISVTDVSENNTITITVSGDGDYEYALDDINGPYQNENVFENVTPGIHTVYVRDRNNCGIVEDLVSVIGFPRFFTPNQDGTNDTWQVFGLNEQFQPNTIIFIFDRYGKLLKELNPLGAGWDGTFNGENLPTNDYWFQVTLQDGRLFTSHFTLKR
ncbi:gliding motility-associated C-terminal domain-containing protein [Flavobacteriaceae bacterium AU392]|nr:gliding motility-associated C-terminal domain-containing protein [Flavobacteriaceae bacterium]RKM82771.1 gliding motility-associated C-terminal domain-containing protein [Flavobacteriaceae bacterium AU392]